MPQTVGAAPWFDATVDTPSKRSDSNDAAVQLLTANDSGTNAHACGTHNWQIGHLAARTRRAMVGNCSAGSCTPSLGIHPWISARGSVASKAQAAPAMTALPLAPSLHIRLECAHWTDKKQYSGMCRESHGIVVAKQSAQRSCSEASAAVARARKASATSRCS